MSSELAGAVLPHGKESTVEVRDILIVMHVYRQDNTVDQSKCWLIAEELRIELRNGDHSEWVGSNYVTLDIDLCFKISSMIISSYISVAHHSWCFKTEIPASIFFPALLSSTGNCLCLWMHAKTLSRGIHAWWLCPKGLATWLCILYSNIISTSFVRALFHITNPFPLPTSFKL